MKALAIAVLNFLWPAMGAALAAYWAKKQEAVQEAQDQAQVAQDQIVQEAQDEIDRIREMSDDELDARLVDVDLVQPGPGPGGSEGLGAADNRHPGTIPRPTSRETN